MVEENGEIKRFRNREREILFMDLRQMGSPYEKKYIELTEEDRAKSRAPTTHGSRKAMKKHIRMCLNFVTAHPSMRLQRTKARFRRLYAQSPIEYRFLCGHDIQSEDDEDALDYYMIGVWLVQHRKYSDWSKEKSFDLAEILEFMRVYRIRIPRYIKRTRFYRKKLT